jgi:preprotein translocase subunit SecF
MFTMLNWFKGVDFFPHGLRLPIVQKSRVFIGISYALMLLSVVLLVTRGLNFGVDFKGGTSIEVRTKAGADGKAPPADIGKLRDLAGGQGLGGVQVQGFSTASDALVRMELQPGDDKAQQNARDKMIGALTAAGYDIRNTEVVGPAVSAELKKWGVYAVIASMLGILLYVWFRFEWQFAVGGIVALFHDVLLTCGLFALTQMEFDLNVVAALLTLAGYSINDTVVTFDRIRENLRKFKRMPLPELINLSINETLSRTILTASTVFMAVLALYVFGTEVIKGFSLAMLFGVIVGTWSSIFVASPLLMQLGLTREKVTGQKDASAKGAAA